MLDRILVPLDESELAECVLPHVATLSKAFGSTITLLHVVETTEQHLGIDPIVDPFQWKLGKAQSSIYLESIVARLQSRHISVHSELLVGRPEECVINFTEMHPVDLIVLSSHGRSGLSEWNIGSTAHKVVQRAGASKLIVHPKHMMPSVHHNELTEHTYQRLLLPLDGSWRAECVLPLAIMLAQRCGAELHVAHVVNVPKMTGHMPLSVEDMNLIQRIEQRNRGEIEQYFDELRERLPIPVQFHIITGESITNGLQNLARQLSIDFVVVSAHGHTGHTLTPYGTITGGFISSTISVFIVQDCQSMPNLSSLSNAVPRQVTAQV